MGFQPSLPDLLNQLWKEMEWQLSKLDHTYILIESVNLVQPTVIMKSEKDPTFWQLAVWFGKQKHI